VIVLVRGPFAVMRVMIVMTERGGLALGAFRREGVRAVVLVPVAAHVAEVREHRVARAEDEEHDRRVALELLLVPMEDPLAEHDRSQADGRRHEDVARGQDQRAEKRAPERPAMALGGQHDRKPVTRRERMDETHECCGKGDEDHLGP
jgi:hypothetical protein